MPLRFLIIVFFLNTLKSLGRVQHMLSVLFVYLFAETTIEKGRDRVPLAIYGFLHDM